MPSDLRTMSVRMPEELYRKSTDVAKRRKQSFNTLVQESLKKAVAEEEKRQLENWFDSLADDPELCDVEYAFAAQAEVVLREEY